MPSSLLLTGALGAVILASGLSSGRVDFANVPRPAIQPRRPAFAIWSAIFPLLLAAATVAGDAARFPPDAVLLLVGSLACTSAWADVLRCRRYDVAAGALFACAGLAWASLARVPADAWVRWAVGLYAGWVSVAAALSLAILAPACFDDPRTLLAASVGVAVGGALLRAPAPAIATLWAGVLQAHPSCASGAAVLASVAGVAAAASRMAA